MQAISILKLNNMAKKYQVSRKNNILKRKGSLLLDIIIGIVLMMIIYYVATVSYPEYRNNANRSQALEDLRTIKQAVISYQGLSKVTPSSITMEDLQEGLSATESLDGTTHEALLKEAKTDPWGGEYVITIDASGAGTISTSAAVSGGGLDKEITIDF